MRLYISRALKHPVTHINVMLIGFLILVGMIHNHAHHTMEVDADSYVRAWCKKNPKVCQSFVDDAY